MGGLGDSDDFKDDLDSIDLLESESKPNEDGFEADLLKAKQEKSLGAFIRMVDVLRIKSEKKAANPKLRNHLSKVEKYLAQQTSESDSLNRGFLLKKVA